MSARASARTSAPWLSRAAAETAAPCWRPWCSSERATADTFAPWVPSGGPDASSSSTPSSTGASSASSSRSSVSSVPSASSRTGSSTSSSWSRSSATSTGRAGRFFPACASATLRPRSAASGGEPAAAATPPAARVRAPAVRAIFLVSTWAVSLRGRLLPASEVIAECCDLVTAMTQVTPPSGRAAEASGEDGRVAASGHRGRRVALFDFDGTLVDSDQALAAPFRALGIPDEAQPPLGLPLVEACERAGVTIEAYLAHYDPTVAPPFDGVPELLDQLARWGLASNKERSSGRAELARLGWRPTVALFSDDFGGREKELGPLL